MIIVKRTDGTENWYVYHSSMGTSKFMRLDLTDAQGTATNLFTITDYSGMDPEVAGRGPITIGVDEGTYPAPRIFSVGVQINF